MQVTFESLIQRQTPIGVIGLGYVGLPLAVHLARHFDVIGFDINPALIERLKNNRDDTGEVTSEELAAVDIQYTIDAAQLKQTPLIIVTVPTPIDAARQPDLTPLRKASITIGQHLQKGTIVVFESTVYPGVTEDYCGPIIAKTSGLVQGQDFHLGYSPERINPGDKEHTVDKIVKVVSGESEPICKLLAEVYAKVVTAGIHRAPDIKTAEAAKVIENTQRDLNIALMNELAVIFNKLGLNTADVLAAAGTKWNFLKFHPGLVGGHCIGVDPYYLTHLAQKIGHHPAVILAGRRINDRVPHFIVEQTIKLMVRGDVHMKHAKVLVLGLTFKENVPDLRNSKVFEIVEELREYGLETWVHDPLVDVPTSLDVNQLDDLDTEHRFDAVIACVKHQEYVERGDQLCDLLKPQGAVADVRGVFDEERVGERGLGYWRL